MDSTSGDCGVEYSNPKSATDLVVSSTSYTAPITEGSSLVLSLRYESQKRRDWKTFLQYLENNKPPLTLASCTASHVIEFLKHLDQFGKTKMHLSVCANFGHRNSPTPCTCPLQQAWGSLDALIGRLRAAYEENGGDPDLNPFGSRAVRLYLKELREVQAKARGITYLKKRKRPTTTSIPTSVAEITQMVHGSVGGGGVFTFVAGGFVTSMKQTAQVVGGNSCNGGGDGGYSCDVNGVVTSMTGITRVVDASRDSGGGSTSDAGGVVTSMTRTTQAIDGSAGACGDSTSDAGGVATSIAGSTQAIDRSTGGCGDSTSDAGGVVTSIAGITHVVDGCSTSTSGLCVTSSDEINQLVDGVIASGGGGSTSDAGGVVNDEKWMMPKFIPGTLVEVNLPDKQCHEAWVPAKILNAGFSQSLFLVGYNNSRLGYEEWCSKATVDALHIRPAPPENLEGKNFHVSEKVDFYYDCGWWSGEVTKVLAGNRYIVRSNYHKIEREFNQFELRCHVEWINGRWVQDSSDSLASTEEEAPLVFPLSVPATPFSGAPPLRTYHRGHCALFPWLQSASGNPIPPTPPITPIMPDLSVINPSDSNDLPHVPHDDSATAESSAPRYPTRQRIPPQRRGGTYKVLKNLLRHKLLHHDSSKYDGFRLTYLGYDFLAVKTLVNRGVFVSVGRQLGVGKESDIFEVATEDGTILAIKLHRLGRVSFRAVKSKRDYLLHRKNFNWLYLSRLAALKEFAFMKALEDHQFPVPKAVDCNRHCIVMSLVEGYPLVQVKELPNPQATFETIIGLVIRLAEHGLIHCDFNEFNIMIDDNENVTMIDFPQMVSVSHRNAEMYFDRDVECIFKFFRKRFNLTFKEDHSEYDRSESDGDNTGRLCFSSIEKSFGKLDKDLAASGFTKKDQEELEKIVAGTDEINRESDDDSESDNDTADERFVPDDCTEASINDMDSLHLDDEQESTVSSGENNEMSGYKQLSKAVEINGPDTLQTSDKQESTVSCDETGDMGKDKDSHVTVEGSGPETIQESEKEDDQESNEDDPELMKRLNKHRRHEMAVARGKRRTSSSRNTYKDKGGKSSNSSKAKQQLDGW